jgi:hypothetical protein
VAKMLETETGSWLYLDIRVYSKNTPTKTGICFPKNEFSSIVDTFSKYYPFEGPITLSGPVPIEIKQSEEKGIYITMDRPIGKRSINLDANEVRSIINLWPELKEQIVNEWCDESEEYDYKVDYSPKMTGVKRAQNLQGDDFVEIFQRAKQSKVLKPRPYNKKQVDKK